MRAARQGMKIEKTYYGKTIKNPIYSIKSLSPKKFGPEGLLQQYDNNGNPTNGLTEAQKLGYEPVVRRDGKAKFIGYDSNPALPYMLSAKRAMSLYRVGGFIKTYKKEHNNVYCGKIPRTVGGVRYKIMCLVFCERQARM